MSKPFRAGMFGGKFMPYHKGHLYCLETASRLCDRVYQLLMANCVDEERILRTLSGDELLALSPERRYARMRAAGRRLGNVETIYMDISQCRTPSGDEDWDAETPLVLRACGHFDAVFGSEPSYAAYFRRAYPWAAYIQVDPPRAHYPISGTRIRADWEELSSWRI